MPAIKSSESQRENVYVLRELQTFLDSLLDITSEAMIWLNEKQEISLFSTGAEAIFGYTKEEIIGRSINIILPTQIQKLHSDHILEFLASGEKSRTIHQHREVYGKRKNGEIFPLEGSISQNKTAGGWILAIILRDISEQRRIEEQILKLSVVVEQTPASVLITDTMGKIEYVNPAFERVTGFSSAEVIGRYPSILKSGLMPQEIYQSMWGKIQAGEVWTGEICNKKKNGELFWELGTVSPIHNKQGVIKYFISVKEDISERKKTEEELNRYRQQLEELVEARTAELRVEINEHQRTELSLREKEQSLDLALRLGHLGSWEYDFSNEEITWAAEVYRIFGLNPAEIKITYETVLDKIHLNDRALVQTALNKAITNRQHLSIDHKIVLEDGQERIINLTGVPFFDKLGVATKMVGTVQDITDRVRIKEELLEKERMSNELAITRSIQLSMLPKESPSVEGWQIACFYQAAKQVSGDFYDFIKLPKMKIGLMVADVCGKGVSASLYMALSRAIVRTNALRGDGPGATLERSNKILNKDFYNGRFVSVLYSSLDPKTGIMEIANAGHCYPLWYSAKNGAIQNIKTNGMVIGIFPKIHVDPVRIEIQPGDVFIFYTDGLTEATNSQGVFFDEERLVEKFYATAQQSANEILSAIVQSWQDFIGELPQADDLTLIVVKRSL